MKACKSTTRPLTFVAITNLPSVKTNKFDVKRYVTETIQLVKDFDINSWTKETIQRSKEWVNFDGTLDFRNNPPVTAVELEKMKKEINFNETINFVDGEVADMGLNAVFFPQGNGFGTHGKIVCSESVAWAEVISHEMGHSVFNLYNPIRQLIPTEKQLQAIATYRLFLGCYIIYLAVVGHIGLAILLTAIAELPRLIEEGTASLIGIRILKRVNIVPKKGYMRGFMSYLILALKNIALTIPALFAYNLISNWVASLF